MKEEQIVTDWDVAAELDVSAVSFVRSAPYRAEQKEANAMMMRAMDALAAPTVCISCGARKDKNGNLPCGGH
ncbi:hypothetical protein [Paraburkholderia terrae]|uniref:hypothetical protein n=1 Tax=Paraburkholderia terrae TaxID=311230 RepID=UPI001EE396A0|nr:hypothetical protein [Paraburkholderia terrae]GJH00240.1 hypothetical protein CBA19C8_06805 [Paraburkholderia terrae]